MKDRDCPEAQLLCFGAFLSGYNSKKEGVLSV